MTHPHVEHALTVPGAYTEEELESLRQEVEKVPTGGIIVEIGVLYGRTASLYMQEGLKRKIQIHLIDNWSVNGEDAFGYFEKMYNEYPRSGISVYSMTSDEAALYIPEGIDLLHIDGNHFPPETFNDCENYLPKLKSGGVVVFHDYNTLDVDGRTLVFPDLHHTIDEYTEGWEYLGTFHSQTKRRKP